MSETSPPDPALMARLASGDVQACLQLIASLENEPAAWMFHQCARLTASDVVTPDGLRVADLAANSLMRALGLAASFEIKPDGQYTPDELGEIRALVRRRVPQ